MQVKHILNRLQKFKSFVYENVRFVEVPGGRWSLRRQSALGPTASPAVRAVLVPVPAMICCRRAGLRLCRCGACRCASSMRPAGWRAHDVGYGWSGCRGRTASLT